MALSKNFFGIRHGSTKSTTFSEFRGTQITKERVVGGGGNADQAARFSEMAKAYQLFKGMISRKDFFREAQKVDVVRYTENGFPLAPWPCSWGSGNRLSIDNFTNFHFDVHGLFTGCIPSEDVMDYLMGGLADANRFRLLPLLEANSCLQSFRIIVDFWYRASSMIRHASTSCNIAFGSTDLNAPLIDPSGVIDANEQSLYFADPFASNRRLSFYAWNEPPSIPLPVTMNIPSVEVLMIAVRSVNDGRLSKSFCYVP